MEDICVDDNIDHYDIKGHISTCYPILVSDFVQKEFRQQMWDVMLF